MDSNLVWVDMEMTGLDPDIDRIIEIAVVVTDSQLNLLGSGPVFAIHQSAEIMDRMDAWNKGTLGRSGLIERVRDSTTTEADAEASLITFLKTGFEEKSVEIIVSDGQSNDDTVLKAKNAGAKVILCRACRRHMLLAL